MDGKTLLYKLRNLLQEDASSGYMDDRTSYDFLYEAAVMFVSRTKCLRATQAITTIAETSEYTLSADYIQLYLKNPSNEFFIKYNNGSTDTFLSEKDYEDIVYENNTTSATIPGNFSIIDDSTLDSQVTGTATSAGAVTGGQCVLTDTTGNFSDVNAGDIVHNTTDGSDGVVLSKTSSTTLVTALFGGTNNDWSSSDAYVIQPQGRMKLKINPPPSTSSHIATVYYIQRPAPVYSDYGVYRFPAQYSDAIIKYAAWLYKYRDEEPNFGNAWFQHWDAGVRQYAQIMKGSTKRTKFTVSFKK